MVGLLKNQSNGLFIANVGYMTLKVPNSYAEVAAGKVAGRCGSSTAHRLVRNLAEYRSERAKYHYVMVFIPEKPYCGRWSGIGAQSCGLPQDRDPAPTDC